MTVFTVRIREILEFDVEITAVSASQALMYAREPYLAPMDQIGDNSDAHSLKRTAKIVQPGEKE